VKALQKDPKYKDKKLLKEQAQIMKDEVVKKMEKDNQEFEEKLKKQKQEEEEMIKKHHNSKVEQQKLEHDEQITKLKQEHEEQRKKAQEDFAVFEKQNLLRMNSEIYCLQLEIQKDMKEFSVVHLKYVEDAWKQFHNDQLKLIEQQHQEEIQLRTKQKREDIDKISASHNDETKLLKEKNKLKNLIL